MNDFIIYLFKSGILISVFYVIYIALLRKETYYNFNRVYLLVTLFLSFVLPFISIQVEQAQVVQAENNFVIAERVFFEATHLVARAEQQAVDNATTYPWIYYVLFTGMIIGTLRIGYQLIGIYINIKKHKLKTDGKYRYVLMDKRHLTHSFFNFIFIHKAEYASTKSKEVMLHEQVHADKWHSLDLLVVGTLSILQWFNPFMFLYKRALTETHEYQADQAIIDSGTDKIYYQQLLLRQARSRVISGLTSTFNQSLIKNRFIMMNKTKSNKSTMIKYLLVVPIALVVSTVFSFSQEKIEISIVEIIQNIPNGEVVRTKSSFAVIDLPEGEKYKFSADKQIAITESLEIVRIEGKALLKLSDRDIKIIADNILINKKEHKIYAYTDDYVPSISPIENNKLKWPAAGFGMRMHPILKIRKMHNGMDFTAKIDAPIIATAHGTVRSSGYKSEEGNQVILDHGNGYSTGYSHLKNFIVEAGQFVKCGDVIGYVGNTGLSAKPHLHYEVIKDGKYVDPKYFIGRSSE